MGIVTNYVCDVSGKSGTNKSEFVTVKINSECYWETSPGTYSTDYNLNVSITKLIHKDIANKLNLIQPKKDAPAQPEVSLEGKLKALLIEYVDSIVEDAVSVHMENSRG